MTQVRNKSSACILLKTQDNLALLFKTFNAKRSSKRKIVAGRFISSL